MGCAYTESLSVPGDTLGPRGVQWREASRLPVRGFWVMKGEKVLRWTRGGRTFQVEGKAGTKTEKQAGLCM